VGGIHGSLKDWDSGLIDRRRRSRINTRLVRMSRLIERAQGSQKIMMEPLETTTTPIESTADQNQAEIHFEDRPIKCVDCGDNFIWTGGEQVFFHDKGLKNEPKRCKTCKQAKNERLAAIAAAQSSGVRQRIEVSVQCAQCGQQTTVPFYPSQGRPVYCRTCFLAAQGTDASVAQA